MMTALYLSLFLSCSATAAPAHQLDVAISIDVIAPADVSDAFVRRMAAEAQAIWGPAGFAFDWHRLGAGAEPHGPGLSVVIESDDKPASDRRAAVGWIMFRTDEPQSTIYLSRGSASLLLTESTSIDDRTLGSYDAMMARALGRALSHELGHYFLRSRTHSRRGLMRALWPTSELFGLARGGFLLTAAERAAATSLLSESR